MQNPRLAGRYAKSLIDIAIEQNKLDVMYADMKGLHDICQTSGEFVQLMKSPIVKADKKHAIIKAMVNGKIDGVTEAFINLIVLKGREFFLPEIISAFISQYKEKNNITDVVLTTSEPLDEELKANLRAKIETSLNGKRLDLTTKVDSSLIGGFVLEANNNLFDASILRDLKDIKKQFLQNLYIPDIR